MATTKRHEIPDSNWLGVFTGPGWAFIQVTGSDPVAVHVGQSAPVTGSPDRISLSVSGLGSVSLTNVPTGDTVYVSSINGDHTSVVCVSGA